MTELEIFELAENLADKVFQKEKTLNCLEKQELTIVFYKTIIKKMADNGLVDSIVKNKESKN